MDRKQFAQIVMALKAYYSDPKYIATREATELWFRQLEDLDYKVCETAINKWVAVNSWPPKIADIRKTAFEVVKGDAIEWSESWEQVQRAIRYYGMYREVEAMLSLDDVTKQVVRRLGFKHLCLSDNLTADRANFRDIWVEVNARQQQNNLLPVNLRQQIGTLRQQAIEARGEDDG